MTISTTGPSSRNERGSRRRAAPRLEDRRGREAGLTMLELILVMVIICTVLAMAAPSLGGFFAARETEDAAAEIVALTRFARSQAAVEGRTYRLNLDAESGRYWLTSQTGGAFERSGSRFARIYVLPEGTRATWEATDGAGERFWIPFYPDGRTEAAEIRLEGRHGDVVSIVCRSPAERFEAAVPAGAAR